MQNLCRVAALVIGLATPSAGLVAQVLVDDDVMPRLVKACPELETDAEINSLSEKADLLAEKTKTGDPKNDAIAQCEYFPAAIKLQERLIVVYNSCLPNTEPYINMWSNLTATGIQNNRNAMVRLGCR